ncbi:hypothetical protein CRM22_004805 [Opisthorchis felineus]|uniref:Noggin n=1 Tax=Opisthorchis felineus TaxID=147828 RepID=A0A4S2M133_OPIFE|nr:hypothetical protein CRM22_004805 [Opisthorchis felineus]
MGPNTRISSKYTHILLTILWIFQLGLVAVTSDFAQNGQLYDHSYTQRKVKIRMTKLAHPPQSGINSPSERDLSNRTLKNDLNFKVGGLGLTSSAHSHISLGSLASTSPDARTKDTQPKNEVYLKQSKVEAVTPDWPTDQQNPASYNEVNMRIMGQPIDPKVINHLHPDVSPFKARKLRKILAGSLDKDWTSETPPRVLRQRGVSGSIGGNVDGTVMQPDMKLINEAQLLNFTFRSEMGNHFSLSEDQIKLFRNWLIDKATCEMEYIWEDLGPLFWPRWIRRGVCMNRQGHSCSWPPGMECRPSGSRALQLLHWKCEDAAYIQSRKRAAEQRNRRRTATNTFQSKFYDMKPDDSTLRSPQEAGEFPRLSLRDTHGSAGVVSQPRIRLHLRTSNWPSPVIHPSQGNDDPLDGGVSMEERRRRRAKRLIKRLSVTANGYHCYWQVQKYLISDRCACLCS